LHTWHSEPLRRKPAPHTQAASVDAPLGEVECSGHCTHVSAACTPAEAGWYVLAAHGVHISLAARAWKLPLAHAAHATPAASASYPARHTQVLTSSRSSATCAVLAGHAWHVEALLAAASVEYVLLAHRVHATLPLLGLKRPA